MTSKVDSKNNLTIFVLALKVIEALLLFVLSSLIPVTENLSVSKRYSAL